MEKLSNRERDLVGLGAALGSNCARSVEKYVSEARKTGLTDQQISEAIKLADGIRSFVAQSVADTVANFISTPPEADAGANPQGQPGADQGREASAEGKAAATNPEPRSAGPDRKCCCC